MHIEGFDAEGYINRITQHTMEAIDAAHRSDQRTGLPRTELLHKAREESRAARLLLNELGVHVYGRLAEAYRERSLVMTGELGWQAATRALTKRQLDAAEYMNLKRFVKLASGCATRGCEAHDREKARDCETVAKSLSKRATVEP